MNRQGAKPAKGRRASREPSERLDRVAAQIVDSAYKVHRELGPGLLETAYEACLCRELQKRGLKVERQVELPIQYDGEVLDVGFRIDLLVEDAIVCELKAAEEKRPIWEAQLLTYLKLSGHELGFLINFNVPKVKDGIKRMISTS